MKENIKLHNETYNPQKQQQIEADLLNDYNYLRQKTRQECEKAKVSLNNSLNLTPASSNNISDVSGITA